MDTKCIAVGNRIMGDDAVAIKILEAISARLEKEGIISIVGETDSEYVYSQIKEDDLIIIIDATCFGIEAGSITSIPMDMALTKLNSYDQHQISIFNLLKNKKLFESHFIGIEVASIDYGMQLSSILQDKFLEMCNAIEGIIKNIWKGSYEY